MTERVPSVLDLVAMGLAEPDRTVPKGGTARYYVSDEGHALMGAALRANGLAAQREHVTPPSRDTPRWWIGKGE